MEQMLDKLSYDLINYIVMLYDIKKRIRYASRLRLVSKKLAENLKEQNYWIAASMGLALKSDSWLIENDFKFNIDKGYEDLLEYITNDPNLCIAGGYPTLQYLGKNPTEYSSSDIDIFIIQKDKGHDGTLRNLLQFMIEKYPSITYSLLGSSVINLKVDELRLIQIIITNKNSIAEVLTCFDSSYCKCGYYMGKTYTTIDAKYSKGKNIAYYFKGNIKKNRIIKASKLGFKIMEVDDINEIKPDAPFKHEYYDLDNEKIDFILELTSEFLIKSDMQMPYFEFSSAILSRIYNFDLIDIAKISIEKRDGGRKINIPGPYHGVKSYTLIYINLFLPSYEVHPFCPIIKNKIELKYTISGKKWDNQMMNNIFVTDDIETVKRIKKICLHIAKIAYPDFPDYDVDKSNREINEDLKSAISFLPMYNDRIYLKNSKAYVTLYNNNNMIDNKLESNTHYQITIRLRFKQFNIGNKKYPCCLSVDHYCISYNKL